MNGPEIAGNTMSTPPEFRPRRAVPAGIIILATLVTFALAAYTRQISGYPPLSLNDLIKSESGAYEFGVVFQELIIPLALIYLLSNTGAFRRIVSSETKPGDGFKLFAMLTMVQVLSLGYTLLTDELTTFGVLVVMASGLLGGWRMGLGLGLVTMLLIGTQEFFYYPDEEILRAYQTGGLPGIFDPALLNDLFFWYYLADLSASSAIWAGLVAGFGANLLGERRFNPLIALGLGTGISLGVFCFTLISWEESTFLTPFLVPMVVVSGLAMAAIALIARNVQAQTAQRKAEAAELALTQAELRALRAQINPHFLFNALNTIRYFVRTDAGAARGLLLDLSEVFQRALRSGEFIPLRDELSYVESYLALEKARLDKRLQVIWFIQTDSGTHDTPPVDNESPLLDYPVPTLILQPIVENAVIHGVARKRGGGSVTITVQQVEHNLLLQVEDDGPGMDTARLAEILNLEQESKSIGLRNVDQRLQTLYGAKHRLVVTGEIGQGTCIQIKIPINEKEGD